MFPRALIASDGADWRRRYQAFKPIFSEALMPRYHAAIAVLAREQVAGGGEVDFVEMFKVLAARVIGACAFGDRLDADGAAERVARANTAMFRHTAAYMNTIEAQIPVLRWLPSAVRRRATAAAAVCRDISRELIGARQSAALRGLGHDDDDFAARAISLLHSGVLTHDEVLDNASLLIVAGHETTAYTMAWMASLLGQHPQIYARCRDEVERVMGAERDVQAAHLDQMKYLQATVTETLRMYPPIAFVERQCKEPFALSDKVVMPAGTSFTVDVFGVQHNPRYWPDPYEARPERHLDSQSGAYQRPPEHAFLAFSAGHRQCPGMRFARREIHLIWAYLLRNFHFDFKVQGQIPLQLGITISPAAPIRAVLSPK